MGKIKRSSKQHQGLIPSETAIKETELKFSFKYLWLEGKVGDFSLHHARDGYSEALLLRLKDMSTVTVGEFLNNRSLRTHPIDFADTTRPNGFEHLNEQLRDKQPWQFQITANEHGRVHGLLLDDTFFVVWVDPDHRLYSST